MKQPATSTRLEPKELQRRRALRDAMRANGVSIAAWAKAHGFNQQLVQGVLCGRFAGERGEAHAICVALKLKKGASVAAGDFDAAAALRDAA